MGTTTASEILYPSGYTGTSSISVTTASGTNYIGNGYKGSGDTSSYARLSLSTSTTGYLYFTFDTSSIPAGATISSVAATVTVRVSNTTRVTNTQCQLFTGTTAKGSNSTFASTTASNTVTLSTGTWTRNELNDLRLKIGGTGSSSSQSKYIYFYGATITVSYTVSTYTVTVQNSSSATVSVSDEEPAEGSDVEVVIDSMTGLTVLDNNVDVTSQFEQLFGSTISKTADSFTTGYSITGIAFYTSSSSSGNNFSYAVGHTAESPGSTSSGSGTWTYVKTTGGSSTNGTGYADFEFDFSDIPPGATISSVQVKCYGAVEDSSQTTSHSDITLYSGSTQKGSTQSFTSSTNSIITLSNIGTWTRDELQDAKLRFSVGYYGGHLFGITWTVTYQVSGYMYTITSVATNHTIVVTSGSVTRTLYFKNSGSWTAATSVYKKVNGSWVLQSDLSSVFNSSTNYIRG